MSFQQSRTVYHVKEFLNLKPGKDQGRHDSNIEGSDTKTKFLKLRDECERFSSGEISLRGCIIDNAYTLARATDIKPYLGSFFGHTRVQAALDLLGFLGRLRAAYYTFLKVAQCFPSFSHVTITFIPAPKRSKARRVPSNQALTAAAVYFESVGIVAPPCIAQPFPEAKLTKLEAHLRAPLHVHAEVQMLFHLLHPEKQIIRPFHYFGISKLTCLLCGRLLAKFSGFETRGNYGKIYPQWSLLRQGRLQKASSALMEKATQTLMETAASLVSTQEQLKLDMVKESVAAISSSPSMHSKPCSPISFVHHQKRERQSREHWAKWCESVAKDLPRSACLSIHTVPF